MRKLLVALVVFFVLLLVADRVAHAVAQKQLASRIQTTEKLSDTPKVHLDGFPFLTQVLGGRYDGGRIEVRNLTVQGITVSRLDATVRGVKVPFTDLIKGNVDRVPVSSVRGTAYVRFPTLVSELDIPDLTLSGSDGRLRVALGLNTPAGRVTAKGSARLSLADGELRFGDISIDSGLPPSVQQYADKAVASISRTVRVDDLPYGLRPTALRVTADGVQLDAYAEDTVLSG